MGKLRNRGNCEKQTGEKGEFDRQLFHGGGIQLPVFLISSFDAKVLFRWAINYINGICIDYMSTQKLERFFSSNVFAFGGWQRTDFYTFSRSSFGMHVYIFFGN